MATPEAGTKRVCPESGKKFYDLNKDPIISPYTGESYPLSFFEVEKAEATKTRSKDKSTDKSLVDDDDDDDDDEIADDVVEIVTLEDADAEVAGGSDVPDLEDDDESEIKLSDDDDTFLETDDDDDDVSDLIVDSDDDDKDI